MNSTILFEAYEEFIQAKSSSIPRLADTNSTKIHEIFRNFKYPISSWPVVIPNEMSKELQAVSTTIPRLMQEIIPLYFKNDTQKVADFYFEGNTMHAEFAMLCLAKKIEISSRLDLTYTDEGFKILEVNMGSSIGGMEFQNFEPLIKDLHTPLQDSNTEVEYVFRNTQSIYIQFLIDQIQASVENIHDEINIFLVTADSKSTPEIQATQSFFNELLVNALHKVNKRGKAYMDTLHSLKYTNDQLYYNNHRIHGVLIFDFALNDMSMDIFRAFTTDKVYFPDHFGTKLLRDKRNLMLLRILAAKETFSTAENELILRHIPWTQVIKNEIVSYDDISVNLIELLKQNKDKFVIKIADGLQGTGVFIGKYTTKENWSAVIEEALINKKYIAQELCESLDFWAPNDIHKWVRNKLIWGSFGFGKTYAGVWVRMSANKSDSGVINSATGAIEAIVYEHQKKCVFTI